MQPRWKATVFTVTPARKWTWRSAARDAGRHISYFGPEANDFGLLEQTFIEYGQSGKGKSRKYLHTYDEAVLWNQVPGTFTATFTGTH